MHLSGTKQEWGKTYTLLRLLEQGEAGERPLQKIIRNDETGKTVYHIEADAVQIESGSHPGRLSRTLCGEKARQILSGIAHSTAAEISIPEAGPLPEALHPGRFYTPVPDGSDVTLCFSDGRTVPVSIKCCTPHHTLLSHRGANLKYDILQARFSNPEAHKINRIENRAARLDEIERLGGKLKYTAPENKIFAGNLAIIDLHFSKLLAELTRQFYRTGIRSVSLLTEEIKRINPYKIKEELLTQHHFYEYKTSSFLLALLGKMKPTKIYRGYPVFPAQLFVYPPENIYFFEASAHREIGDFLYRSAFLSVPDSDSCQFGFIEKENGQWYIKLNSEINI